MNRNGIVLAVLALLTTQIAQAAETCHYVSRDGKEWTTEKVFCFDYDGENYLNVRVAEKGKELFQGKYVAESLQCAEGVTCFHNTPDKAFPAPETYPDFPVLQWLPANYEFDLYYAQSEALSAGIMDVDVDIANVMYFCSADPASPAAEACRKLSEPK